MQLAVSTATFRQGLEGRRSWKDIRDLVQASGFPSVEVCFTPDDLLSGGWREAKEALSALKVCQLALDWQTDCREIPASYPQALGQLINAARAFGVHDLVVNPVTCTGLVDDGKDEYEANVKLFKPYSEELQKETMRFCFCNQAAPSAGWAIPLRYGQRVDELFALIQASPEGTASLCWDTASANDSRIRQGRAIRGLGAFIATTHIADSHYGKRNERHIPGCGEVDWRDVMQAFAQIGYQGTLCLKTERTFSHMSKALALVMAPYLYRNARDLKEGRAC